MCSEGAQLKRLAFNHFRKLATPLDDASFDREHFRHVNEFVSSLPIYAPDPQFDSNFTREEISSVLGELKNKKATGADRISYELFKYGEKPAVEMLLAAGNFFWDGVGVVLRPFPLCWNTSPSLLPLYKKNSRFTFDNYRGIEIGSPAIKKIFTRVLNKRALDFVKSKLSPSQNGFIRGCQGPLFVLSEVIRNSVAQKKKLAVIAVDLKNAFDLVSHPCLWYQVHTIGIG